MSFPAAASVATLIILCAAGPIALVVGGRWIWRRAETADHIESFIDAHVPEVGDVFAQQEALAILERRSMVAEIETLLDEALAVVEGWTP